MWYIYIVWRRYDNQFLFTSEEYQCSLSVVNKFKDETGRENIRIWNIRTYEVTKYIRPETLAVVTCLAKRWANSSRCQRIRDLKFSVRRCGIQQIDGQNEAYVWRWFIVPLCKRRTRRTLHDVVTYSIEANERV